MDATEYEAERLVFNRAFDKRPAVIVRCASSADVARSLEFSQERGLLVAVHGGGHNRAGLSVCDDGLVIDLSAMNRVDVDQDARVARARAGALTVQVDAAVQDDPVARSTSVKWVIALRDKLRLFASGTYVNQLGRRAKSWSGWRTERTMRAFAQ